MSVAVTAAQSAAINHAAEIFGDGVAAFNQVQGQLFSAGDQLKGQAMVSSAGSQLATALSRWSGDFNNIIQTTKAMQDQLLSTVSQTVSTNQANEEIAAALSYKTGSGS